MIKEDSPHRKAMLLDSVVYKALAAMKIATPYKKSDSWGEQERQRVFRYLILELHKQSKENPRLHS
jgi:hypothetical protein